MAEITLTEIPSTATTAIDTTKHFQATTATLSINPTFSSVTRTSNNIAFGQNFNISNLDSPTTGNRSSTPGILTGRRPRFGQLFPRGYFNR